MEPEAVEASTRAARYLELYDTNYDSHTNKTEAQALVARYDLKHGDVVSDPNSPFIETMEPSLSFATPMTVVQDT